LLFGLAVGMYMGVSGQFAFISAHSHVSLVGWTTMALVGLAYLALPACERSRLAAVHFWLHNVGLPVKMLGGLMFKAAGRDTAEPFCCAGSALVLVADADVHDQCLRERRGGIEVAVPRRRRARRGIRSGPVAGWPCWASAVWRSSV